MKKKKKKKKYYPKAHKKYQQKTYSSPYKEFDISLRDLVTKGKVKDK